MKRIVSRKYPEDARKTLEQEGIDPVLARVYAARGIRSSGEMERSLDRLVPFGKLKNAGRMAEILADAVQEGKRLLIVADYDSDGATACAVGMSALAAMGACVDYIVPNRFEYGYGLTPEIVRLASEKKPDFIVTVDNGIASVEGVNEAKSMGIEVLVTDHHLPGDRLPDALCIVNPNQPGCEFPSKHLAGVGVMFYVMMALRAELRNRGHFDGKEPNLAALLDLVALGTVADVVKLDANNRILVSQGLQRMRNGKARAGIDALFSVAKRDPSRASSYDLGFMLGPRLNAAGRLEDMSIGIECLLSRDAGRAFEFADRLDGLNRERKSIESQMQQEANATLESVDFEGKYSISLFDPNWHQGIIGILASRIKDRHHRPSVAFARGNEGEIKGSGRSIPGFHLRDALDLVSKKHPGLILKFGGHAQAAGLTVREEDFSRFREAFEEAASALLSESDLEKIIETDGVLEASHMTLDLAKRMEQEVWGQGFPEPQFEGIFSVVNQRMVGEKHLKLKLGFGSRTFDAMLFFHADPLPDSVRAVYGLSVNEYNGSSTLQLLIRHWEENQDS